MLVACWPNGRVSDLLARGHGFGSHLGQCQVFTTWMGDCLWTGKPSWYINNTKVNSVFHGQITSPICPHCDIGEKTAEHFSSAEMDIRMPTELC